MSYDISFKVKVEGTNEYVEVGDCSANITWNLRDMIVASTGLEWNNESNNGYVKDIIVNIQHGYAELCLHPGLYKCFESPNGWGTIEGCRRFFRDIMDSWNDFQERYPALADVATFWVT